jgi:hypothetical protein
MRTGQGGTVEATDKRAYNAPYGFACGSTTPTEAAAQELQSSELVGALYEHFGVRNPKAE